MADPRGFMKVDRAVAERRPADERRHDWREVYPHTPGRAVLPIIGSQASRCMDCGIPFCHNACPLGNIIPEFNDLVYRGRWHEATDTLLSTNNFPEFTGRLCPAPCEAACVVGINGEPVTIKNVEVAIADKAREEDRLTPFVAERHSGSHVAIVGSGPAGLAAAQQLTRAGHAVVVFERDDAIGGLLRYGIPEFKMEKAVLDRRLRQMEEEGTVFAPSTSIGTDVTGDELLATFDAVVLATGSTVPRDLPLPGRDLAGVHQAMEFLPQATRVAHGQDVPDQITAAGKHVVVIGGGDTGSDCVGTSVRQGAASVTQLEILPMPSTQRPDHQPWPTFPTTFKISTSHEEGDIDRQYAVSASELIGQDGRVSGVRLVDVTIADGRPTPVPDTERVIPAELVLFAMGFTGPERTGAAEQFGAEFDDRGNIVRGADFASSRRGVFVAGDCGRGQSLIVWAIAEGRSVAHEVDAYLRGEPSRLPRPVDPTTRPLVL